MSFFTPPPPMPVPTDPATFRTRAINAWTWLSTTLLAEFDALYTLFTAAVAAMNTNDTRDTSTSSVLIGTGTKVFTVSAGKSFSAGQWLTISNTPAPTNQMIANVTSYSGTTLTVTVPTNGVFGSGTLAAWTIALTAAPSEQIAATFVPVASAATLADSRTALDVPSNAEAAALSALKSIDYTLSANAITLKLNPTTLSFRSTTLTSGAPVSVSNASQITTTISSGSTGGTVSGQQSDIVLLAINSAGVMELAWANLVGGLNLDGTNLINTVAEGGAGAADSSNVVYSTTARTGVAYKVVGIFRSTQTVAGTWAQTPSLVQGFVGAEFSASRLKSKTNVTGSRSVNTTYYNTSGVPRQVNIVGAGPAAFSTYSLTVDGDIMCSFQPANASAIGTLQAEVQPGKSYIVSAGFAPTTWTETA